MDENLKKGLLIGLVVVAVIVAAFVGFKSLGGDQMQAINEVAPPPPGWKSMKDREIEAQNSGKAPTPQENFGSLDGSNTAASGN